tara:strand:+ start:172 stop:876 length:705 start_codon:yes stop_codon:yes gene_type:complete
MLARGRSLVAFARYSASQVFAGKFIYFLLLALLIFCAVVVIHTAQEEVPPSAATVYYFLLVPGVLLMFYPSTYSVQSDVDGRMLETLFGIPDYRYKVWLARHLVQQLAIALILLLLAALSEMALADFSVWGMVFHLMFPIFFLSSLGFMLATLVRSGNGSAALLLIQSLFFWIMVEPLEDSRWNLFHNPFAQAEAYETIIQQSTTFYNRAYLLAGAVLTTLFGLLRLQQRERFV